MSRRVIRGIVNPSTACHISSALVILCHCLLPIRHALLLLLRTTTTTSSSSRNTETIRHALLEFVKEYCGYREEEHETDNLQQHQLQQPMNATNFFRALSKLGILQAEDVGDAVSALAKLLDHLRTPSTSFLAAVIAATLDGTTHLVIQDSQRRKTLPGRPMTCPYLVRAIAAGQAQTSSSSISLEEALRQSLEPQELQGYQWTGDYEHYSNTSETTEDFAEIDNTNNIPIPDCIGSTNDPPRATTKTRVLDRVPPIWILQLERFGFAALAPNQDIGVDDRRKSKKQLLTAVMDIPLRLHVSSFYGKTNVDGGAGDYRLTGGIVYIQQEEDDDDEDKEDEEDAGHTVALVRCCDDEENFNWDEEEEQQQWWNLVDDDSVRQVSSKKARGMLSGCQVDDPDDRGRRMTARGLLLVYQRIDWEWKPIVDGLMMTTMQEEAKAAGQQSTNTPNGTTSTGDWSKSLELVGRRVRVKWAKEKFYNGVVSGYDAGTGKHTVTYDDGDVRSYKLEKKTLQWI